MWLNLQTLQRISENSPVSIRPFIWHFGVCVGRGWVKQQVSFPLSPSCMHFQDPVWQFAPVWEGGLWTGRLAWLQIALPTSLLISKVPVIRSSFQVHRWEGVKSYTRNYKQCILVKRSKRREFIFRGLFPPQSLVSKWGEEEGKKIGAGERDGL